MEINVGSIFAGFVFGGIGFAAFIYGKKTVDARSMVIGIVLMVFPYLVPDVLWQCVIGVALTAALFLFR